MMLTMKSVHVRNIFQVLVPVDAPPRSLSVVSQLLTSGDEFGFAVIDVLTKAKFEYKVHIFNAFYGAKKTAVQNCLAWAKRNPISFQLDKDSEKIQGIILRIKIQQGYFDFRRITKQNLQLMVQCTSDGVGSTNKKASSYIIQLLPKKRKGKYDIEVVIPLEWRDESYDLQGDNSGLEPSVDNSPEMIYYSSEGQVSYDGSSPDHAHPVNFNPVSVYDENNQLELDLVHESPTEMYNIAPSSHSNTNEQYMVLYNGNAEVIGNFRALNFYKASDINIKEDIRLITECTLRSLNASEFNFFFKVADARDTLMRIDGVDYKFKKGINHATNKRFIGYIAQQVESVVPDAVQLIDGILHVDYESLIPYLSESVRANFNDIKHTQAKTERIEKIVDQLYQQFLKQQQKEQVSTKSVPDTPKPRPTRRSSIFSWKVITATVLTTVLLAVIGVVLFMTMPANPINNGPISTERPGEQYRRALEDLYVATNGANWKRNDKWMTNSSVCEWYGVMSCNDYLTLALPNNNLSGTLSSSLGDVTVFSLKLQYNQIEGAVPGSFAQFAFLMHLDLSHNKLTRVNLNDLFGIGSLSTLDLSYNNISGLLPQVPTSSLLSSLNLSHNNFFNQLPDLSKLAFLESLDLSHNNFSGVIPVLPSTLRYISFESNFLSGEIWRLKRVSFPTLVIEINLANNDFFGEVPFDADDLSRIKYFNMSNNRFTSVATQEAKLRQDMICDATNVYFQCPIPDWLAVRCSAMCGNYA